MIKKQIVPFSSCFLEKSFQQEISQSDMYVLSPGWILKEECKNNGKKLTPFSLYVGGGSERGEDQNSSTLMDTKV